MAYTMNRFRFWRYLQGDFLYRAYLKLRKVFKILISIVIATLLVGLYALFGETLLPKLTDQSTSSIMKADPLICFQALLFLSLLSASSITDIRKREIPNHICTAIAMTGLLSFTLVKLLGILAALPFLIAGLCCGGIGGGDIKLTAAAGVVLGLKGAMAGTMLGLTAMLLFHALSKIFRKPLVVKVEAAYPLAPFLSLGFLVIYFLTLGGKYI